MSSSAIRQRLSRWAVARVMITGCALSAAGWYFGLDLWYSLLFGFTVTTMIVVVAIVLEIEVSDTVWRGGPTTRGKGARNDVASLSWSLRDSWGAVSSAAQWRVVGIARQRLALSHLDLQNPSDQAAIEALIGRRAYRLLASKHPRKVRLGALIQCLDALEALDPHGPQRNRPQPRRRLRRWHRPSGGGIRER